MNMEEIVAVTTHRDFVLIFTRNGTIYRMTFSPDGNDFNIEKMVDLNR